MDLDDGGLFSQPFGYPNGSYDGPLSFQSETPDPLSRCGASTAGVPITVIFPADVKGDVSTGGAISEISLTDETARQPVELFCQRQRQNDIGDPRSKAFAFPRAPLIPGHTYRASVSWTPDWHASEIPYTWQFEVAGANASGPAAQRPGTPRRAAALTVSRSVRVGKPIIVRYRPAARGRLTVIASRGGKGTARRTITVRPGARRALLRLRLRPGRYLLRSRLQAGRQRSSLTSSLTVRSAPTTRNRR